MPGIHLQDRTHAIEFGHEQKGKTVYFVKLAFGMTLVLRNYALLRLV
jgi:hypothetical protein